MKERFLKLLSPKNQFLAKGSLWLSLAQVASALCALALSLAFANLVSQEIYGTYKYLLSIASLLAIITLPGITTSLTRSVARGFDRSLFIATRERFKWACFAALVALAVAGYYFWYGNVAISLGVLIIAVFLPFFDTFTTFSSYLLGSQRYRENSFVTVTIQAVATGAMLVALFSTRSLLPVLATYFAAYTLMRLGFFLRISKKIPDTERDPELIPYGKHLSLMGILAAVAGNIDSLVLFHFLGAAELALYTVATAAPDQIKSLLATLSTVVFPQIAEGDIEVAKRKTKTLFLPFAGASILLVCIYILIAPLFFHYFFPRYESAVFLSQLFSASLLVIALEPAFIFLSARGMVREQYISTTISYVLQIGAIVLLGIPFGLVGVIIARILTRLVGNVINLYLFAFPLRR